MRSTDTFTPTEAAAFAQVPCKRVYKELEHRVIVGPESPRMPFAALVYLSAMRLMDIRFSVDERTRLYSRLFEALADSHDVDVIEVATLLSLRVGPVIRELDDKIQRFRKWRERLVIDPGIMGGETVFPRSRVTVLRVGEMLQRGEAPTVIMEDYPFLSPSDLEFASIYVKAYPRVGRPAVSHSATH